MFNLFFNIFLHIPLALIAESAVVTAIVVSVIMTAISTGISIGVSYLMRKPIKAGERDFQTNRTDTRAYLPVVYGKELLGINRIFSEVSDGQSRLWIVGAICHGPVRRILKVFFDKELVWGWNSEWIEIRVQGSTGNATIQTKNWPGNYKTVNPVVIPGVDKFQINGTGQEYTVDLNSATDFDKNGYLTLTISPVLQATATVDSKVQFTTGETKRGGDYAHVGKWGQKVGIYPHYGSDTEEAEEALIEAFPDKWTSEHRGRGVAYIVCYLLYDIDYFPNGLPEITCLVEGTKIHDIRSVNYPNDAPFWSDNPALCTLDYLTRGTYPYVSATRIGDTNPDDNTHTEYIQKYGLSAHYSTEIMQNTFIAEANFCDEMVNTTLELPKSIKGNVADAKTKINETLIATVSSTPTITLTNEPIKGSLFIYDSNNNFVSDEISLEIGGYDLDGKVVTFGTLYSGEIFTVSYYYESSQGRLNPKTEYKYKTTYVTTYGESSPSEPSHIMKTTKTDRTILLSNIPESDNDAVTQIKIYRTVGGNFDNYYYIATIDNDENADYVDSISDNGTGSGILTGSTIYKVKNNGTYLDQSITTGFWNTSKNSVVKQGDTFYFVYKNANNQWIVEDEIRYIVTAQNGSINTSLGYNSNGGGQCIFYFRKAILTDNIYVADTTKGAIRQYDINTEVIFDNPRDTRTNLSSITSNNNGGKQKRFTCNGFVDTEKDIKDNIEDLLTSCRGNIFYESGKYSIFIKKTSIPEDFELTEDNIIGDWKWGASGIRETCNTFKVSWVNPKKKWKTDYVFWPPKEQLLNQYLLDDNNFENQKDLDLFYTNNKQTARQIAMVLRREFRQSLTCTCSVTEAALQVKVGSLIKVTHSTPGWVKKLFWVQAININPNSTISLSLAEYDPAVYDYDVIDADPAESADTTLFDPLQAPDEVTNVTTTTEFFVDKSTPNYRIRVDYTDSASPFWHHSDVYLRKGEETDINHYTYYTTIDKLNEEVFYIYPVEAFINYYIKIQSVSTLGVKQEFGDVTEYTHEVILEPPGKIKGLEAFTRGNDGNVYGRYFAVKWQPIASSGFGDGTVDTTVSQGQTAVYEGIKYYVEIALQFPQNVLNYLSGQKWDDFIVVREEVVTTTKYMYTYEDNIEDVNRIFEPLGESKDQTANDYYNTYYGNPQRTIMISISAIDQYNQMGESSSILLGNPAPDMLNENGINTSPDLYAEKNAIRVEWRHPFQEYDIDNFIVKLAEAYNPDDPEGSDGVTIFSEARVWKAFTIFPQDTLVYPTKPNGHIYKVVSNPTSGRTGLSEPNWPVPDANTPHPTVINGACTFQHNSVYLNNKVASLSSVTSSDDEIETINYVWTIRKLDPKKVYITQVVPYDVYGRGSPSSISTLSPGLSHDDDEENILSPSQVDTPTFSLPLGNNTIKISWDAVPEIDVFRYIVDWRGSGNNTMPSLAEVTQGYLDSDPNVKCYGYTVQVDNDNQTDDKNHILIQDAKQGYTYWARVRAFNTSGQDGAWSAFGTHYLVFEIPGIGADDFNINFREYYFTGTLTATDNNTCSWSSGTLKFKKASGTSTNDYSIVSGNSGNLASNAWLIWKGSGTAFETVNDATLFGTSTYKDAVTIAYLIPNADVLQKITILPTQDSKNMIISSSVIAANSVIAAMIQAGAVKADKIDVNGDITLTHSSGGRIILRDNSAINRIAISTFNGGVPFIRVSKSGYDATSETSPDNLLFDSTYNYLKIIEQGTDTVSWSGGLVGANSIGYEDNFITVTNNSVVRTVMACAEIDTGFIRMFPYLEPVNGQIGKWISYEIIYDHGSSPDKIIVRRVLINATGSSYTFLANNNVVINWYLFAETIAT